MDAISSIIWSTQIDTLSALIRLIISLLLGGAIGFERQLRHRDAGLRTFTLICIGSTCAMLISIWIPQLYPDFLNGDPGRIAAQVLTGVGFLGAGAILRGRGSVQGLTTAACIWIVSVIGLAVGAGFFGGAVIATLLTLFVLVCGEYLERFSSIGGANRILVVHCSTALPNVDELKNVLESAGVRSSSHTYQCDFEKNQSVVTIKVSVHSRVSQQELRKKMSELEYVSSINMEA
ncbi:MAG: MgtC/SapB family protein [Salinivirgaceae bacterium]|nr:MgtC/SapB family protein [Salinivirgaceae bacterium]